MSFLTAEWRKLAIANYEIDKSLLRNYIPYGTELDLWNGRCYISLVGFMFLNTKLLGVSVPFHSDFEKVNLRFYVKRMENGEWKRGVVFIKEIVPKYVLSLIANLVYNEHYETMKMAHKWEVSEACRVVEYKWRKNNNWYSIRVVSESTPIKIEKGSEAEFITEHYLGYAKVDTSNTNEYEVAHPRWQQYPVIQSEINVDFRSVYGDQFEFLSEMNPASVLLAEGSEVTVENKRKIE